MLSDLPTSSANLFITFRTASTSHETSVTNRRVSKIVLVMNCLQKKHQNVVISWTSSWSLRSISPKPKRRIRITAAAECFNVDGNSSRSISWPSCTYYTEWTNECWVAKVVKRVPKPPTYAGYMAFFFPKSPNRGEESQRPMEEEEAEEPLLVVVLSAMLCTTTTSNERTSFERPSGLLLLQTQTSVGLLRRDYVC